MDDRRNFGRIRLKWIIKTYTVRVWAGVTYVGTDLVMKVALLINSN
jgi:hypothetical protein